MAYDKLVDSAKLDGALKCTADAIRAKTGGTDSIPWSETEGFKSAVDGISGTSGGNPKDITVRVEEETIIVTAMDGSGDKTTTVWEVLDPPFRSSCWQVTSDTQLTVDINTRKNTNSYRYYRLNITDFRRASQPDVQKEYANIGEFALYDSQGNNIARTSGAIYSATSTYNQGTSDERLVDYAFDGDPATVWESDWKNELNATNWIQVELPNTTFVSSIGICTRGDTTSYLDYPKDFALLGSNDGAVWDVISEWSDLNDGWAIATMRNFALIPTVGDWMLATVTTRSTTIYPDGWTILYESEPLNSDNSNQRMALLCKQISDAGNGSFTITQTDYARIYINLISMSGINGFLYHDDTDYINNDKLSTHVVARPDYANLIWACSANLWRSSSPYYSWYCPELETYKVVDLGSSTQSRQANFWDDKPGDTRSFLVSSGDANSAAIVACIEVLQ